MTAEIVSIGTELLLGQIADTNAQTLGVLLAEHGVAHHRRTTVGDNRTRVARAIQEALERADLVFTIGGLGPTEDDVTREAIADALGLPLEIDEPTLNTLRARREALGRPWLESLARQARKPRGAVMLPNSVGTAPGIVAKQRDRVVIALPGPKAEFYAMLEVHVRPLLASLSDGVIVSKILTILDVPESIVENVVEDLIHSENPTVAPLMHAGEVQLRLTARAKHRAEAERMIEPLAHTIRSRFGPKAFDGDPVATLVHSLRLANLKLTVAESCTGGLLGETLTRVPGASDVFLGGVVAYSNEVKASLLGVAHTDLNQFGAVSETVAVQMAAGARRALGSDYALSITGIAGPGGDTESKPVGLVFIGVAGPRGDHAIKRRYGGTRELIRGRAVSSALVLLREELMHG
ncbi:MAG: competence/damage-inducible protein A [Armatimonadota bacterium]